MATPFAARAGRLSTSLEKAFGELFTFDAFMPTYDVNGRKIPDTTRASFDAVAIWEGPAKSKTPSARGVADDNAHNWTASFPSVNIDDYKMIWPLQPGDKVTRQFDGSFYEVARSYPNSFGRTTLQLTAKKRWLSL
jgi:hypothetical protein